MFGARLGIRQEDFREARLDDDVADRRVRHVADALRLQDRRSVTLAQGLEPLADLLAKERVRERKPRFAEGDERRATVAKRRCTR